MAWLVGSWQIEHWSKIKRILRHIRGTSDNTLCYEGSYFTIRGYVDFDFSSGIDKRKFTTDYVFTLAGGSWVLKLQNVVALSTTKPEYRIATRVCEDVIWIKRLTKKFEHKQDTILLYCD